MKKTEIYIVTSDVFLGRMLTLELAGVGYAAERLSEFRSGEPRPGEQRSGEPRLPDPRALVVADLDSPQTAGILARLGGASGGSGPRGTLLLSRSPPPSAEEGGAMLLRRPFLVTDFIAAVNELIARRTAGRPPSSPADELTINERAATAYFRGEAVSLTRREFELLNYLWRKRGEAVTRDEAIRQVWGYDFAGDTNVVDVYIRYLRSKLDEAYGVKLIHTIRGKGYQI